MRARLGSLARNFAASPSTPGRDARRERFNPTTPKIPAWPRCKPSPKRTERPRRGRTNRAGGSSGLARKAVHHGGEESIDSACQTTSTFDDGEERKASI